MYKISYTGDGVTDTFAFAFPFFQEADIRVACDENVLPTDKYGVIANEDMTGGTVVLAEPLAEGAQLDIFRQISLNRVIDYQPTSVIDPEKLNADFNFLLAAFSDMRAIDIDLAQWKNTHDNVLAFLKYNMDVVLDSLGGQNVMGLYKNLLTVLGDALPKLINDYGSITEVAPNELCDDYGLL